MEKLLFACLMTGMLFCGCRKEDVKDQPTPYDLQAPEGFPQMNIPLDNPMTVEGVELGRRLYHDNILSTNGNACASCHFQDKGFSSPSPGPGGMSIMAHINVGWSRYFGWNGGETLLDHVPLADLAEGNAFLAANNDSIKARFARHTDYQERFRIAYGVEIHELSTAERQAYIAMALAQFIRTQISSDSPFDRYKRGETHGMSESALRGMDIFFTEKGDCFHCHGYPLMTDGDFHNNGLDQVLWDGNLGRGAVTGISSDHGKFKSPTLRNVALTAPYMHDGRYSTLEEVIEHYNSYVRFTETLDPLLTRGNLGLSAQDKADLLAFLESLTDSTFITNPALENPF